MKETISYLETQIEMMLNNAQYQQSAGDHINAKRNRRMAKDLQKIVKLARAIFLS
jgi:hypothetical protein